MLRVNAHKLISILPVNSLSYIVIMYYRSQHACFLSEILALEYNNDCVWHQGVLCNAYLIWDTSYTKKHFRGLIFTGPHQSTKIMPLKYLVLYGMYTCICFEDIRYL